MFIATSLNITYSHPFTLRIKVLYGHKLLVTSMLVLLQASVCSSAAVFDHPEIGS